MYNSTSGTTHPEFFFFFFLPFVVVVVVTSNETPFSINSPPPPSPQHMIHPTSPVMSTPSSSLICPPPQPPHFTHSPPNSHFTPHPHPTNHLLPPLSPAKNQTLGPVTHLWQPYWITFHTGGTPKTSGASKSFVRSCNLQRTKAHWSSHHRFLYYRY